MSIPSNKENETEVLEWQLLEAETQDGSLSIATYLLQCHESSLFRRDFWRSPRQINSS